MNMRQNEPVQPGDIVLDIGCYTTQDLREKGYEPPAKRVRVIAVYDWGLRIAALDDENDLWDCQHWIKCDEPNGESR